MATEPTPATVTPTEGGNEPQKVTFTDEQQTKIQELINAAVARTSRTVRTEHEQKVAELTQQLEALKTAPAPKTNEESKAMKDEFKAIVEQQKAEAERFRQAAADRERDLVQARAEAQEIRKEVAIANATAKIPFFDPNIVKAITKDEISYDSELNQFVVKGPNGQTRYDSSLEKPLSLEAYYTEFAAKNKYLVRSTLASGTGSTEATRTDVSGSGRYAVTDIFGPKSSSQKAMQLMKESPSEYARLKGIARQEGLIAA